MNSIDNIKVSVIIPFFSHVDWLKEAIDSILDQTYKNIEIIVVNDGSSEDVSLFLKEYGKYIIYIFKENEGPGAARNVGIDISTGDYICFLDSDDKWMPHKTHEQLEYMLINNLVWSHTGGEYFISSSNCKKTFNFSKNSGRIAKRGLITMQIATPSVMIRSDILKNNSFLRFNKEMRFSQDSFLYILMAQKYDLGYYDKNCVLIRLRDATEGSGLINASKRYRIRFTGRSYTYNYLMSEQNKFVPQLPLYINYLFKQYVWGDKLLIHLEKNGLQKETIELISKFMFAYLYLFGRLYVLFNDYIINLEMK